MATKPTLSSPRAQNQPHAQVHESEVQQEMRFDRAARALPRTAASDAELAARYDLLRARATLLTHVPVNSVKETGLFLNMTQIGQAPTPLCPYYNKMRLPTVSIYNWIGPNVASIRLDPTALEHIPRHVLGMAGDLTGKSIDLFWTAVDARWLIKQIAADESRGKHRSLNLCTHSWTWPHALKGDASKRDILMGICPETGFKPAQDLGAIAINRLSLMEVHSHDDLYSPDNAHFEPIPGSPFGVLWAVTKKDNQIAITKMLVLFQYDQEYNQDPITQALANTFRYCPNLDTHLQRLDTVWETINSTFEQVLIAFDKDHPEAMKEFNKLHPGFQGGILQELKALKGQPDITLAQCSNPERAAATRRFVKKLQYLLVESQLDLLLNSQPLVRGDNVLKLMSCAQLFSENRAPEGYQQFGNFTDKEKGEVYFATWEICRCPRGNNKFGEETFFSDRTPNDMKKEAILLAASRLTPEFNNPPINPTPPPLPVVANTPGEVREAILKMLFEEEYQKAGPEKKRELVMQQLNRLELPMRNQIFGKIWELSPDPQKRGDRWGEIHVADDIETLVGALMEVITENMQ